MSQSKPIQHKFVGYAENGQTMVISPNAGKQLKLYDIRLLNRSSANSDIGFFKKTADATLDFFSLDSGVATDITALIEAVTPTPIFTTNSGSGLIVQSPKPISLVGINITTAQTGTPTLDVQYYNGSGIVDVPDILKTVVYTGTGYAQLVITPPSDWVSGDGGTFAGLDQTKFTLFISQSASPSAGSADAILVAGMVEFSSGIPSDNGLERTYSIEYPLYLEANEGIIPYFSSASPKNQVTLYYSQED